MANKVITFTDPVADDCIRLSIRFDGAGAITMVEGDIKVANNDATLSTYQASSSSLDVSTMIKEEKDAAILLATSLVAKFKGKSGF